MRLYDAEPESDGLNLTPIIDVVFLLLIFFLVATRFNEEEKELSVRLAEVAQAQPLSMAPNEVVINITQEGHYVVVGETIDEKQLENFLHTLSVKNPSRQSVQIRADDRVPFRYPARVMSLCEREDLRHYCTVVQER